jgi:hypothetical protein
MPGSFRIVNTNSKRLLSTLGAHDTPSWMATTCLALLVWLGL